jgi:hypothetical protein
MEAMGREIDGGKLGVLDDDAGLVGIGSISARTLRPALVEVAAISWTMTWWLNSG